MDDYTRSQILNGFARGEYPAQVFGPDRPRHIVAMRAIIRGIEPSESEKIAAVSGIGAHKVAAYRNGKKWLESTYNTLLDSDLQ